MKLIERFRLTKQLHDQVELSGESVETVLRSWKDKDYKSLCEYITQCKGVVPKYVSRLAALTGASTKHVVMDILSAQVVSGQNGGDSKESASGYMPDDAMEQAALLKSLVYEQQRYL